MSANKYQEESRSLGAGRRQKQGSRHDSVDEGAGNGGTGRAYR